MVERMKKKGRNMIAWVLAGCMSIGLLFVSPETAQAATQMVSVQVTYGQSEARAMLDRINSFRTDAEQAWAYDSNNNRVSYSGLGNLQYDYELEQVAMKRAAEIALSYGHTRPNGEKCFTAYTFSYGGAGENIAAGSSSIFSSEERVFNAWKEDNENYSGQGHRRNMLGKNYTAVGIGHVKYDGMDYWVQEFSSNGSGMSQTEANDSVSVVEIETSDSYIQDMKATKTSLSVKKGETKELSDLQIMLLVYDHFGNNDYCCTKADYTASVTDTSIATCDHNRLTGVKAGKTTLTLSAYGKNCEIEVTVTESEGSKEDPKPDEGNQSTETGKEEDNKQITIVNQPQSVHGVIGSKVAFQVQAKGTGLTYQWRYNNDGQISDQRYSYFNRSSDSSLSLMVTKKTASATYWCHITDQYGNSINTEPCKIQCDIREGYMANGICGNQINWTLDSEGLMTIEGSGSINAEDIPWGDYVDDVKSVVMKGKISKIGVRAFAHMTSLRSVKFPDSLNKIDEEAFYDTGLSYFELPDGVKEIGDCAFAYISGWSNRDKKISLPKNLTKIGNKAFYRSELPLIYIPSSVREIGQEAFAYVDLLQCEQGSYAEAYAKENQLKYEIVKNGTNPNQGQLPENNGGQQGGQESGGGSSGFGKGTQDSGENSANKGEQGNPSDSENKGNNQNPNSTETAPDDGTGSSSESVKLKITYPSKKIAAGQKVTLAITEDVIWKSSNSNYATVNEKGVVTTKKAGAGKTVTITAVSKEDNHVTDSIKICIMKNAVTKIKVKNPPKTVTAGKSVTINASVVTNGKNVNKTLKWTTSNSKYASVNANGKVVAKKAGKGKTVTITAQSTDGTNKKVKIRIKIK